MSLLEVRDLQIGFSTEKGFLLAVDRVSFEIAEGECVGMVGESGSGKSVTALSLLRLLPEPPARITGGKVTFAGTELLLAPAEQIECHRGRDVGFVFQDPMTSLNPVYTVGYQVAEALERHHPELSFKERHAQAVEMLQKVGVPSAEERARCYPHQLSGGLRQRVLIAMALINRPRLLVADEPTTALDVSLQAQILQVISDRVRDARMSLLLISHDLGVIRGFVDRVIVMYAGRIVETAPARDFFDSPLHPYSKALLACMPSLKAPVRRKLPVIEGTVPKGLPGVQGCRFADRCPWVQAHCREQEPRLEDRPGHRSVRCFEV